MVIYCQDVWLQNSSLTYEHLELAYEKDGFDGLYYLLSEKDSMGKTRVTKSKKCYAEIGKPFSQTA